MFIPFGDMIHFVQSFSNGWIFKPPTRGIVISLGDLWCANMKSYQHCGIAVGTGYDTLWCFRNPDQLTSWYGKYPIIYVFFSTSQVVVWDFWTINSMTNYIPAGNWSSNFGLTSLLLALMFLLTLLLHHLYHQNPPNMSLPSPPTHTNTWIHA